MGRMERGKWGPGESWLSGVPCDTGHSTSQSEPQLPHHLKGYKILRAGGARGDSWVAAEPLKFYHYHCLVYVGGGAGEQWATQRGTNSSQGQQTEVLSDSS